MPAGETSNTRAASWVAGWMLAMMFRKGTPSQAHSITNSEALTVATRSSVPRLLLKAGWRRETVGKGKPDCVGTTEKWTERATDPVGTTGISFSAQNRLS